MNIFGHMYVCTANLNYVTGSFHSRYNTTRELYKTIAFAPVFFFISAVICLRAVHDLSETPCASVTLTVGCKDRPYTWWECFQYNQFVWFPSFLVGLQMTHIDRGFMTQWYFSVD